MIVGKAAPRKLRDSRIDKANLRKQKEIKGHKGDDENSIKGVIFTGGNV